MPQFRVTALRCFDDVYEVEAKDTDEAAELVSDGHGTLISEEEGGISVQEVFPMRNDESTPTI